MKTYVVNPGCAFRRADGSLAEAGERIELDPCVAAQFPGHVTLLPEQGAGDPAAPATTNPQE